MIDNICSSELSGSVFRETQIRKAEEKEISSTFKECSNQVEPLLLKLGNEGKYISLVCAKLFNKTTLPHVIRQSSRGRTHLLPRFFIPLHPSYFIPQLRPLAVNHSVLLKSSQRKILSTAFRWVEILFGMFSLFFFQNSCLRMQATLLFSGTTTWFPCKIPDFDGGGGW